MHRILPAIVCILGTFHLLAQEPTKEMLAPCGTPPGISTWLKSYLSKPDIGTADRTDDTLWVALEVHLLAKDNGSGRFAYDKVLDAFCRLNADYAPANIRFYLKNGFDLINNTAWYMHSTIPQGIDMMLSNNVQGAFNTYFVADPAGNCGYNLPYGGVAISHGCAAASDHTWAHEAGHALSLPHPFIGWEGKTYSYSVPTPELLTYDYTYFHDTLDTPPTPLDTALVESVDGSNCNIAADLFCDTKPDYLSYRWNCNAQHVSSVKEKDALGAEFYSDGTVFMSYSDDACQSRFTPGEIAAMRANLMTEKAVWVAPAVLEAPTVGVALAIEPVQDQPEPVSGVKLTWSSVPNATYYLVQASRFANFAVREVDVITSDTSMVTGPLILNKTYHWRVKAFNLWHACTDFNESATFVTVPQTSTYSPDWEGWRCYPSLMAAGKPLQMEIPEQWRGEEALARIYDSAGKLVWSQYLLLYSPKMKVDLPSRSWQSGVYHFLLTTERGVKQQAIFVEK